jgi:rhodanese-related sulfurtransferase
VIARRTLTSCTEATAAPSAPKLKLTALISVRPPGAAANTAVTASMEVREAATRAVAIPVEVKIVVIRAAGHRARAGAKLVPGHPEAY